jgi:hypothetical protein
MLDSKGPAADKELPIFGRWGTTRDTIAAAGHPQQGLEIQSPSGPMLVVGRRKAAEPRQLELLRLHSSASMTPHCTCYGEDSGQVLIPNSIARGWRQLNELLLTNHKRGSGTDFS